MMRGKSELPARSDIEADIEASREEMRDKEENLDALAKDVETVRRTLESLDFSGTLEGAEEVESAVEKAEDVTVEIFDQEDQELDQKQDANEDYQNEMDDRSKSTESDAASLDDAAGEIATQETMDALNEAKESALREVEFLAEQIERVRQAREESEQIQQSLGSLIRSSRQG
ncbi:MAG: hypothetical protein JXR73_16205 [Candidatus Omnitrophica bacterium]|nr:hypothetical protein [Candidatus Omnitrophota bacterium]